MEKIRKLVRDNIPSIIEKDGKKAHWRMLHPQDFTNKLMKKVHEEYVELKNAKGHEDKIEEIVDMVEVLYALSSNLGVSPWELNQRRTAKNIEKGAFKQRVYLTHITQKDAKW